MENEFTSDIPETGTTPPDEELQINDSEEPVITDGDPVPKESSSDIQTMTLTVSDYGDLALSSIPIGVLSGAIFMIVGLGIMVIVKIFKKA